MPLTFLFLALSFLLLCSRQSSDKSVASWDKLPQRFNDPVSIVCRGSCPNDRGYYSQIGISIKPAQRAEWLIQPFYAKQEEQSGKDERVMGGGGCCTNKINININHGIVLLEGLLTAVKLEP